MSNTIVIPSLPVTISPSSLTTDNGFYTDTLPTKEDTFSLTRDRNNLIIGCVLGVILFLSFLVAFIFTVKLYHQRKKQQEKYNNQDQLEKTSFLLLDPGSQFSLAVKRASEIPNSPTN